MWTSALFQQPFLDAVVGPPNLTKLIFKDQIINFVLYTAYSPFTRGSVSFV